MSGPESPVWNLTEIDLVVAALLTLIVLEIGARLIVRLAAWRNRVLSNRKLGKGARFTRASDATVIDDDGTIRTVKINEVRK